MGEGSEGKSTGWGPQAAMTVGFSGGSFGLRGLPNPPCRAFRGSCPLLESATLSNCLPLSEPQCPCLKSQGGRVGVRWALFSQESMQGPPWWGQTRTRPCLPSLTCLCPGVPGSPLPLHNLPPRPLCGPALRLEEASPSPKASSSRHPDRSGRNMNTPRARATQGLYVATPLCPVSLPGPPPCMLQKPQPCCPFL